MTKKPTTQTGRLRLSLALAMTEQSEKAARKPFLDRVSQARGLLMGKAR